MVRKRESKKHHGVSRGDGRVGKDGGGRGAVNHKAPSGAGGKLTHLHLYRNLEVLLRS